MLDRYEGMDAEALLNELMLWIQNANEQRMKRYERRAVRKLVWWTEELDRKKKRVRKCRRAYQCARRNDKECVDDKKNEYRQALRNYKTEIFRVKDVNWKRFVSTMGNKEPWGDVYKICMGKYAGERLCGIRIGDRVTDTWKESVDALMERFFLRASRETKTRTENSQTDRCFEWEELERAVKSMKLRKAPGLDGICAKMIRVIWRAIPEWLKRVYNLCYGMLP